MPSKKVCNGGGPLTAPALVGALDVVTSHEGIEVGLYLLKALVELLVEGDLVELLLHRLVKPFNTPVGCGCRGFVFVCSTPFRC